MTIYSTNRQIPRPEETDGPVDLPPLFAARDTVLDTFIPAGSGPLALRPDPGQPPRFYVVTDANNRLDMDIGTDWITIGATTGDLRMSAQASLGLGWLLCNGAAVSRTTYDDLYSAIGTIFGPGNGSSTFNIPDFRGRTPIGSGTGTGLTNRPLGSTGGEETHVLSTGEMPAHRHTAESWVSAYNYARDPNPITDIGINTLPSSNVRVPARITASQTEWVDASGPITHSHVIDPTGGGNPHNNLQPYQTINVFIKT